MGSDYEILSRLPGYFVKMGERLAGLVAIRASLTRNQLYVAEQNERRLEILIYYYLSSLISNLSALTTFDYISPYHTFNTSLQPRNLGRV